MSLKELLICLVIGYLLGCIMTADLIARFQKKNIFEMGTGNPGMANTGHVLGKKAAAAVLIGDILKCLLAVVICTRLFPQDQGSACLLAGLGCELGHCFPFWHHFEGGKGVAVVCTAWILYDPLWGILALAAGGLVILLKGGVKLGALVIVLVFMGWIAIVHTGTPAFWIALIMGVLMAWLNLRPNRLNAEAESPIDPDTNKSESD